MIRSLSNETGAAPAQGYIAAATFVAGSILVALAVEPAGGTSAIDLLFLPAVLGAAVFGGLGPALLAAIASTLAYNFFFTAPRMTFHVDDPSDLVTIVILFVVAAVVSQLAASVRTQANLAQGHARRNATIAGFSRQLLSCTTEAQLAEVATGQIRDLFDCNAVLMGPDGRQIAATPASLALTPGDLAVVAFVLDNGEPAGRGVDRAVPSEWQFHPVRGEQAVGAAMGLARDDGMPAIRPEQIALLNSLLDQLALALDRSRLEREAGEFARSRERDQVRSTLLSSIGLELGPTVGAIADSIAALRREGAGNKALLTQAASDTAKVDRYLANLLDLNPESEQRPIDAGAFQIDLFHRSVTRNGQQVRLAPKEYAVLAELAKHPGRVLTHGHLLRIAWGPAHETQIDYLRVAIRGLRRKLEDDPALPSVIINEPAVGYRLIAA